MPDDVETFNWFWLLVFYLLGFALLFAELFIPAAGIMGVVGLLCCGYSIYELFANGESATAWTAIIVSIVYSVVLIRWWLVKITDKSSLGVSDSSGADIRRATSLVGTHGVARSALRPAGIADLDGDRYDVVATGGFVETGDAVRVVEVNGNRIVVRRHDGSDS